MQPDALHCVVAHKWLAVVGLQDQEDDGRDDRDVSDSRSSIVRQSALRRNITSTDRCRCRLGHLREAAGGRRWWGCAQRSAAMLAECGTGWGFLGARWATNGN